MWLVNWEAFLSSSALINSSIYTATLPFTLEEVCMQSYVLYIHIIYLIALRVDAQESVLGHPGVRFKMG